MKITECNPGVVLHIGIYNPGWEVRQGFLKGEYIEGVRVMAGSDWERREY